MRVVVYLVVSGFANPAAEPWSPRPVSADESRSIGRTIPERREFFGTPLVAGASTAAHSTPRAPCKVGTRCVRRSTRSPSRSVRRCRRAGAPGGRSSSPSTPRSTGRPSRTRRRSCERSPLPSLFPPLRSEAAVRYGLDHVARSNDSCSFACIYKKASQHTPDAGPFMDGTMVRARALAATTPDAPTLHSAFAPPAPPRRPDRPRLALPPTSPRPPIADGDRSQAPRPGGASRPSTVRGRDSAIRRGGEKSRRRRCLRGRAPRGTRRGRRGRRGDHHRVRREQTRGPRRRGKPRDRKLTAIRVDPRRPRVRERVSRATR